MIAWILKYTGLLKALGVLAIIVGLFAMLHHYVVVPMREMYLEQGRNERQKEIDDLLKELNAVKESLNAKIAEVETASTEAANRVAQEKKRASAAYSELNKLYAELAKRTDAGDFSALPAELRKPPSPPGSGLGNSAVNVINMGVLNAIR